jgi:hypothetical protein
MKEISILLPSLRFNALAKSISEFDNTNSDVDYEIVVVSPFEVEGIKTVWVPEIGRLGTILAEKIALRKARGEYIVYFSDDVSPTKDCLKNMLEFMKQHKDPFIGAFKMATSYGKEIGPFGAYNKLYACYGCLSKNTIELLNGYLSTDFQYSWADIDLSLRCWEANGSVEICQDAVVIPRQIEDEVYKSHRHTFQEDFEVFLKKWHDKLGQGIVRHDGAVNHKL